VGSADDHVVTGCARYVGCGETLGDYGRSKPAKHNCESRLSADPIGGFPLNPLEML
jgi:hypothetical protein